MKEKNYVKGRQITNDLKLFSIHRNPVLLREKNCSHLFGDIKVVSGQMYRPVAITSQY